MEFSDFGKKLTERSGILMLMDDLGRPLPPHLKAYPLGGGNPARIADVESVYRREVEKLLREGERFENLLGHYDAPQGRMEFLDAVAAYFSREYGWPITRDNVVVTNGSQCAMFYLFNLFSGSFGKNKKTLLFPLMPEYVGYADQGIDRNTFVSIPSKCEYYDNHTFKYTLDIPAVEEYMEKHKEVGAICVSRPTNPSGNVLTDKEISALADLAKRYQIPLIIDNAYGLPFPNIIFSEQKPVWNENIVLSMSLSKIGLPSIRTGIVIARKEIAEALSNINAIAALASGSFGQALAADLIRSGEMERMAREYVRPYYYSKAKKTETFINKFFEGTDYYYHKIEGSIFVWLYLPRLSIPAKEFYQRLKEIGVLTIPGEYSFFGHEDQAKGLPYPHKHYDKCLRINYSAEDDIVEEGIRMIAEKYREYYI